MDISGRYTLHAPREQVWDALLDPGALKRAVPGCESLERTGENEYAMRLHVDAAGIKGSYDGTLKVLDAQKPERFRLVADGAGARGILHGDGVLRLEANDAQTTDVNYAGQAQLGGTIASIGVAVAGHEAKTLINQYFARLADALGASVPAGATATRPGDALAAPATPAASAIPATPPASLASSLPRTAPIIASPAAQAAQMEPAEALASPASPARPAPSATLPPPSAAPAAAATQTAASARQQPGWRQWFRRLLRRG